MLTSNTFLTHFGGLGWGGLGEKEHGRFCKDHLLWKACSLSLCIPVSNKVTVYLIKVSFGSLLLRVLAAPAEGQSSVPSTHVAGLTAAYHSGSRESGLCEKNEIKFRCY